MKILADENIEIEIVVALRQAGHAVSDIKEISPGVEDPNVLEIATNLDAILLTNDKDFGELVYRDKLVSNGVILLRFGKLDIDQRIDLLLGILIERESEMSRAFTVITTAGVRVRK